MSSSTPLTKEHGSTCFENASKYFDNTHIGNHWLWRLKQKAGEKRQCKWLKVADSGCEVRQFRICQWSDVGCEGNRGVEDDSRYSSWRNLENAVATSRDKSCRLLWLHHFFKCDHYETPGKVSCDQNTSSPILSDWKYRGLVNYDKRLLKLE